MSVSSNNELSPYSRNHLPSRSSGTPDVETGHSNPAMALFGAGLRGVLKRLYLGLGAAFFLFASTPLAVGRENWPDVYNAPIYFYSTNMEPVRVRLTHRISEHEIVSSEMTVPRAYILYADGYTRREYAELPSIVETKHLIISFVSPDGQPLSIAIGAPPIANRQERRPSKVADWRSKQYEIELYYSSSVKEFAEGSMERMTRQAKPVGITEGMKTFREGSSLIFFDEHPAREFFYVRCFERGNPSYFCTTTARLSDKIRAEIKFLDFRFNGGRAFLIAQVSAARRMACSFVPAGCHSNALQ